MAIVANNDNPASHQVITVDVDLLSKPETEDERKEREENGMSKIFLGIVKEEYTAEVMSDDTYLVTSNIKEECVNAEGEDFSYMYKWYLLNTSTLTEVKKGDY